MLGLLKYGDSFHLYVLMKHNDEVKLDEAFHLYTLQLSSMECFPCTHSKSLISNSKAGMQMNIFTWILIFSFDIAEVSTKTALFLYFDISSKTPA